MKEKLLELKSALTGELLFDALHKSIYATDASVYREIPLAVCYPKNKEDIKLLIDFATQNHIGLIPRTAGTSLAGQCVGSGLVVDVSKHFNKILNHFRFQVAVLFLQPPHGSFTFQLQGTCPPWPACTRPRLPSASGPYPYPCIAV